MIVTKIIQEGLKTHLEGEQSTYKYSSNLEIQFVKDKEYEAYTVTPFFKLQNGIIGKLSINSNGIFKLDERFFLSDEPFYLSFQLVKDDEVVHLGLIRMMVGDSVGNETTILPEEKTLWVEYVDQEIDSYFKANFQPKLNDFNAKYDDTSSKYKTIVEKSNEVSTNTKNVATNTESAKSYMESAQESANSILNGLGMHIVDGCVCMEGE